MTSMENFKELHTQETFLIFVVTVSSHVLCAATTASLHAVHQPLHNIPTLSQRPFTPNHEFKDGRHSRKSNFIQSNFIQSNFIPSNIRRVRNNEDQIDNDENNYQPNKASLSSFSSSPFPKNSKSAAEINSTRRRPDTIHSQSSSSLLHAPRSNGDTSYSPNSNSDPHEVPSAKTRRQNNGASDSTDIIDFKIRNRRRREIKNNIKNSRGTFQTKQKPSHSLTSTQRKLNSQSQTYRADNEKLRKPVLYRRKKKSSPAFPNQSDDMDQSERTSQLVLHGSPNENVRTKLTPQEIDDSTYLDNEVYPLPDSRNNLAADSQVFENTGGKSRLDNLLLLAWSLAKGDRSHHNNNNNILHPISDDDDNVLEPLKATTTSKRSNSFPHILKPGRQHKLIRNRGYRSTIDLNQTPTFLKLQPNYDFLSRSLGGSIHNGPLQSFATDSEEVGGISGLYPHSLQNMQRTTRARSRGRYRNSGGVSRHMCNFRRATVEMLLEYFRTGKMCGSSVVRIRYGLGRK